MNSILPYGRVYPMKKQAVNVILEVKGGVSGFLEQMNEK